MMYQVSTQIELGNLTGEVLQVDVEKLVMTAGNRYVMELHGNHGLSLLSYSRSSYYQSLKYIIFCCMYSECNNNSL